MNNYENKILSYIYICDTKHNQRNLDRTSCLWLVVLLPVNYPVILTIDFMTMTIIKGQRIFNIAEYVNGRVSLFCM